MGKVEHLTLYFPCYWAHSKFDSCWKTPSASGHFNSNRNALITMSYHRQFSEKMGADMLCNIQAAIDKGTKYYEISGGTKHTWDNSPAGTKIHIPLGLLEEDFQHLLKQYGE